MQKSSTLYLNWKQANRVEKNSDLKYNFDSYKKKNKEIEIANII